MDNKSKLLESTHTVKTSRWTRPDILQNRFQKDPDKRYRWVKLSEVTTFVNGLDHRGWEVVKLKEGTTNADYNGKFGQFTKKGLDSAAMVGDLILCSMPKEKVKQRNEYYRQVNKEATHAARKPSEDKGLQQVGFDRGQEITGPANKLTKPIKGSVYTK